MKWLGKVAPSLLSFISFILYLLKFLNFSVCLILEGGDFCLQVVEGGEHDSGEFRTVQRKPIRILDTATHQISEYPDLVHWIKLI